ncbi:MAG: ABC transporter ATP-binding protein [Dehalococcoidia bacterium]
MSKLIETQGLTKAYGNLVAVDSLDLELDEGEVYGFLGPNGSGKSTTILMLLGLTEPTSGSVQVCGFDPTRDPLSIKRQVGYLPESVGFYGDMTGRENLRYTAELNNIPRAEADRRIADLLETVTLTESADRPVGQYSRGMRQRLGIADVLLKEPRFIILDDPTLGLDPTGIQWLLEIIEDLSHNKGITIFLSSHQLEEVQRVCDRVGIMSHGKMVLQGTVGDLTRQTGKGGYRLTLEVGAESPGLIEVLGKIPGVSSCEQDGTTIILESQGDVRSKAALAVIEHGVDLLEVRAQNRTLQDIYLRYFQTG